MPLDTRSQTWTIASGQTVSGSIDKGSLELAGVQLPATFTGTGVTFQTSNDNVTFQALEWEGAAVDFTTSQGKNISWDPAKFAPWRYIKIVSDGAEGAARTLTPQFRRYR
jgi:hypothetical protein